MKKLTIVSIVLAAILSGCGNSSISLVKSTPIEQVAVTDLPKSEILLWSDVVYDENNAESIENLYEQYSEKCEDDDGTLYDDLSVITEGEEVKVVFQCIAAH